VAEVGQRWGQSGGVRGEGGGYSENESRVDGSFTSGGER
jgi:hypothetical protein